MHIFSLYVSWYNDYRLNQPVYCWRKQWVAVTIVWKFLKKWGSNHQPFNSRTFFTPVVENYGLLQSVSTLIQIKLGGFGVHLTSSKWSVELRSSHQKYKTENEVWELTFDLPGCWYQFLFLKALVLTHLFYRVCYLRNNIGRKSDYRFSEKDCQLSQQVANLSLSLFSKITRVFCYCAFVWMACHPTLLSLSFIALMITQSS